MVGSGEQKRVALPAVVRWARRGKQPDGYLTEERKAQDPDQGFSTFFSETGMPTIFPRRPLSRR